MNVASRTARAAASPPALRGAYRPLFLAGALWAPIVVILWVTSFTGGPPLPTRLGPLAWHQHEMIFGYLGAVIAGFLSAAIPNWTGRPAYSGTPVAAFFLLWLGARLANLFSASLPPLLAPALDVGFYLVLALAAAREIVAARNRNLPVIGVLLLFSLACALDHAPSLGLSVSEGLGMRAGFALVLMLIGLIGGRIIPAFTRNWLARQGRQAVAPGPSDRFDLLALAALGAALAAWTAVPAGGATAILLLVAAAFHFARLGRWSGHRTVRDPLLVILHVGYLWLPVGLALLGLALLGLLPTSPAAHALAAGTMGTMTLAVMTRASLGHTGRPLVADGPTVLVYILVTLGALLRVVGPFLPLDPSLMLRLSGWAWGGAFLLFAFAYGPKLLTARADGRL